MVRFCDKPPEIHHMFVWSYAARQARMGSIWMTEAADRCRFRDRIQRYSPTINTILCNIHRNKIFYSRFNK